MAISAGSFSRLDVFETCKFRARLAFVDKIPEPDRGAPPSGMAEWANDRGSRVHDECDSYLRGIRKELPDFKTAVEWETLLNALRDNFAKGVVIPEEMWCFDEDWQTCAVDDYPRIKFRVKADVVMFLNEFEAVVIDFKTGKKAGNEVKHNSQCQVYAIGAFLRFPKLKKVTTELWYLDLPEEDIMSVVYTKKQAMKLHKGLDARLERMLTEKAFQPNPNKYNCRWCPYKKTGTGHCEVGV